jgi:hypothetical protein
MPAAVAAVVLTAPVLAWAAVPDWQFRNWQWVALALAAPAVGWAVDRRPPGPLGVLAATGPVAAAGWSVYLMVIGGAGPPGSPWQLPGDVPLAAAAVLATVVLSARGTDDPPRRALIAFVVGCAVAALGFGLGRGTGPDAVAGAAAVLVAGSPAALLLAPRRTRRVDVVVVPEDLLTTGDLEIRAVHADADADAVRRFAAALHLAALPDAIGSDTAPAGPRDAIPPDAEPTTGEPTAGEPTGGEASGGEASGGEPTVAEPPDGERPTPSPCERLGRAVVAAADGPAVDGATLALPGVSDLDGRPGTGLRGIVSELHGDRVVAHAVLVGPHEWLAGHGVAGPDGAGAGALVVAWDGVARGWLEVAEAARPGAAAVIRALHRRGVDVVAAGPDDPADRLRAAGRAVAVVPARDGRGGPRARDLAAVARAVRRQHRHVRLRRVSLATATVAAAGGAAAALVGVLDPGTAAAVPVTAAALVVASTRRRRHPFGATA